MSGIFNPKDPDAAIAAHVAASDPHTGYVLESTANLPNGYVALNVFGLFNGDMISTNTIANGRLATMVGPSFKGKTGNVPNPGSPEDLTPLQANDILHVVNTVTGDTTLGSHHILLVNAAGGPKTMTLPQASTVPQRCYTIKKIDSTSNAVTVDGFSSELIDGQLTIVLESLDALKIICDGSAWWII